ncbi:MAG: hypothetical protein V1853_02920 [bacterium]
MFKRLYKNNQGVEILFIIVISSLMLIIFTAALYLINAEKRLSKRATDREQVFTIAEAGINYYRWHLTHDSDDYTDGDLVILDDFSISDYQQAYLDISETYYTDSTDTLTLIPEELTDLLWIKTKQADYDQTNTDFFTFETNRLVNVYLGYDDRGTPPDWLTSAFIDTGLTISVSDSGASPLHVWQAQFSAGQITLGGNLADGASGALSMYTISVSAAPGSGPFIHDYLDFYGQTMGHYSLTVTPPASGSTITTVSSTGYLISEPNLKRTIVARFGEPSFSEYSVVANSVMRFGIGTESYGHIHSNNGIRFDGVAHGLITSSCNTYDDPDHVGPNEDCVHTHQPDPNTVFLGGKEFPVAPIDFGNITADLAQIKADAQSSSGVYLPPSGDEGYHIVLKTDDTMDLYRVTSQSICRYRIGGWSSYNDIYSVGNQTSFIYEGGSSLNVPFPTNGIVFAEDEIWIDGQIDTAQITVVAAREPLASGNATIIINNDLLYTNYDGSDIIGLIAQEDISSGFYSEDDLRIDAAVIAQKGRAGRYYYRDFHLDANRYNPDNCGQFVNRSVLTSYGSIATYNRYGWAYTDGTGYAIRNLIFDDNLVFGPPPSFPTTGQYVMISWEEK